MKHNQTKYRVLINNNIIYTVLTVGIYHDDRLGASIPLG